MCFTDGCIGRRVFEPGQRRARRVCPIIISTIASLRWAIFVILAFGVASASAQAASPEIYGKDFNLIGGTVLPASYLFDVREAPGQEHTAEVEITDAIGGGVFELDGVQYDGVTFTVPGASLSALTYIAGSSGNDTITARAAIGEAWSPAVTSNISISAGMAGMVIDLARGEVFLPDQGWLTANAFFEYSYANSDLFGGIGYVQPLEALRGFVTYNE